MIIRWSLSCSSTLIYYYSSIPSGILCHILSDIWPPAVEIGSAHWGLAFVVEGGPRRKYEEEEEEGCISDKIQRPSFSRWGEDHRSRHWTNQSEFYPTFSAHLGSEAVSPSSCTRLRLSYDEAQRCPMALHGFSPYFACAVGLQDHIWLFIAIECSDRLNMIKCSPIRPTPT